METIEIDLHSKVTEPCYVALGNFDGVHCGHQKLLKSLVQKAKSEKKIAAVLVFKDHTRNQFSEKSYPLLTSQNQKYKIFEKIGIERIYEMNFTKEVMTLSPEDFFYRLLLEQLQVLGVFVGFDYRFGYQAMGDTDLLREFCGKTGRNLFVLDSVNSHDEKISSSRIRSLIAEGKMEDARELLGRPYELDGCVVMGKGLGKRALFPTANLDLDTNYAIPKYGVYDSFFYVRGKKYVAATNVGTNPTTDHGGLKVESYLYDFNGDIYGEKASLQLLSFIRPELFFGSIQELKDQMKEDLIRISSNHRHSTNN